MTTDAKMTREEFDAIIAPAWEKWQEGGNYGLSDVFWIALKPYLRALDVPQGMVPSDESIEHAREYCEDDGIRCPSVHRDALVTMAREILRLAAAPTNAAPQEGQSGNWPLGQSGTPTNAAPTREEAMSKRHTHTVWRGKFEDGCPRCIELAKAPAAPTDTPRTDAAEVDLGGVNVTIKGRWVGADFARELERGQRRIALDVIEAAAKECEQESTGDGITGTYQASWGRYLAGAVRALNVDKIIGRKP